VTQSSSGTNASVANPLLLVIGSALVGALLAGGIKIDLPSSPGSVVVVQMPGASGAADAVTGSAEPAVVVPSAAPANEATSTPSPVPAPRIQTFDWAAVGGGIVGGFGLIGLAALALYAARTAWSRREVDDIEITFDARPDFIRGAGIVALGLVFGGLLTMLLSPTIEVLFDKTPRIVPTAAPAASVAPPPAATPDPAAATATPVTATPTPSVAPTTVPSVSPSASPSGSASVAPSG
jgi:hypothetical protein